LADLPKGTTLLEKKMGTGGVNTSELALLKDFKFSTEKMLQEWMWKYGLRRLAAGMTTCSFLLRTIVLRPPARTKSRSTLYGPATLARLRENLRTTSNTPSLKFPAMGVTYHHSK
jgi:hypothetical protein